VFNVFTSSLPAWSSEIKAALCFCVRPDIVTYQVEDSQQIIHATGSNPTAPNVNGSNMAILRTSEDGKH
jgi:hypothetical protein